MGHVIGLDPGPERSALVVFDGTAPEITRYGANPDILDFLCDYRSILPLVIEQVASFGMPVGEEVFGTVFWSGRFAQAYGFDYVRRLKRLEVKMALCHDSRAKDSNVRQAILDMYGGKARAIGRKASPGPLYGISGDLWSALAVAIAWTRLQGVQNL
jgi:hypothetical protein